MEEPKSDDLSTVNLFSRFNKPLLIALSANNRPRPTAGVLVALLVSDKSAEVEA